MQQSRYSAAIGELEGKAPGNGFCAGANGRLAACVEFHLARLHQLVRVRRSDCGSARTTSCRMSEKPPPIKLHAHRLVAENLRFELFFDHIEAPDGQQVENYLVVAPRGKTGERGTGVAAVPGRGGR